MDMSITKVSEENQIHMVKGCIKRRVFSIWMFYKKNFHSHFSEDKKTTGGFIMNLTNIQGTQNRWLRMQRIAVKTHTVLCTNAIKNMKMKSNG